MNYVVIILGVIAIFLLYLLIKVLSATAVELTASANLNDDITSIPIKNAPTNSRYAYGLWVYVNSWDMGTTKTLFQRNENIKLYLDSSAPILNCDITMSDGNVKTVEITDNFPLQKWVWIIVSVDNQYVDCYLDGKLVKSGRAYGESADDGMSVPKVPPNEDTNMKLGGNSRWDAYVTKFKHWSGPVNPETAHSTYLEGNGQSSFNNFFSRYGLDILIKKDNVEQTKLSIF
jgi:hypothetical protein